MSLPMIHCLCVSHSLHPSVPKEAKYASKDDVFPDGTAVRKGDLISFSPWVMGRTEELWPNAHAFRPERFYSRTVDGDDSGVLSKQITLSKPSPFLFIAFQAGPRTCLGQNMAILEMKCCLARLLSSFKFELAQSEDSVTYCNTITLPIRGGLKVKSTKA